MSKAGYALADTTGPPMNVPYADNICPEGFCVVLGCSNCGEMALSKNDGPAFCTEHPHAEVVPFRRDTCTHRRMASNAS